MEPSCQHCTLTFLKYHRNLEKDDGMKFAALYFMNFGKQTHDHSYHSFIGMSQASHQNSPSQRASSFGYGPSGSIASVPTRNRFCRSTNLSGERWDTNASPISWLASWVQTTRMPTLITDGKLRKSGWRTGQGSQIQGCTRTSAEIPVVFGRSHGV